MQTSFKKWNCEPNLQWVSFFRRSQAALELKTYGQGKQQVMIGEEGAFPPKCTGAFWNTENNINALFLKKNYNCKPR